VSSSSDTLLNESKVNFSVLSILKRINIYWLIITVVVFITLVKLGFWQSGRALEKEQRLARIESLNQKAPISLQKLVALSTTENINDFPVLASGYFDAEKIFLLDNQVSNGRLGYRVLQVLTTPEYSVLVNLGWVQGAVSRQKLPDITPLVGEQHFESRVRIIEPGIVLMAQDFSSVNWPLRIQQIELDKFSTLLNKPLLPFVLYVSETEKIGFVKQWQPIVMPPEKHQGYAFQWFSLAFAWFCLMCWAAFGQRNK
jgi:cytochrome oxidase assembly protein ShyY1